MKRYAILLAAVVMQLCLGATYSWSVFVQPLKAATGLLQGPVQLPFTVFYFVFPATMVLAGSLLPGIGPRRCAVFGGVVFGGGWMLASLGSGSFLFTVMGIGAMAGFGVGFAYIVPIATCIQWFPRHKGLVTGIAVAGFGGGAALVSQVAGRLLAAGMDPFDTFRYFGICFLVLVTLAGSTMAAPASPAKTGKTCSLPLKKILGVHRFWLLYGAMFSGLAAGFTINANLKELYPGGSLETGIAAVSIFALANAVGRITWGAVFDRTSPVAAIQANLALQALVCLGHAWILRSPSGLLIFAAAAGFNYGGVLVLYVSSTARTWGSHRVGQVYGWLFSANIPAAFAPLAAGYGFDRWGGFAIPLTAIGALLFAAVLVVRRRRHRLAAAP